MCITNTNSNGIHCIGCTVYETTCEYGYGGLSTPIVLSLGYNVNHTTGSLMLANVHGVIKVVTTEYLCHSVVVSVKDGTCLNITLFGHARLGTPNGCTDTFGYDVTSEAALTYCPGMNDETVSMASPSISDVLLHAIGIDTCADGGHSAPQLLHYTRQTVGCSQRVLIGYPLGDGPQNTLSYTSVVH